MQARGMIHGSLVLWTLTVIVLLCSTSWAHGNGIASGTWGGPTGTMGCGACHKVAGAIPPTILTGPITVAPGSTNLFILDMTTDGSRTRGAMNASSLSSSLGDSGVLLLATGGNSANTSTISGANSRTEITHSSAKTATTGHVLWDFQLTASNTCGSSTTIYAWANNVDGNGSGCDSWNRATLTVTVQCTEAANGTACNSGTQCVSGKCVDGVCCDTTCGGGVATDCQACNISGSVGTCSPSPAATVCRAAAGSCDVEEVCSGTATACPSDAFSSSGTVCRVASCAAGVATTTTLCSGTAATCPAANTQACAPFLCAGSACATNCSTQADCAEGANCTGGVCKPKLGNGQPCSAPADCTSDFCVDAVCCAAACGGQCQACNLQGSVGTCTPVVGAPLGSRSACATDGSACAGSCDGVKTNGCTYPDSATQCRQASCSLGVATLASNCTGTGICPAVQTQDCTSYGCANNQCNGNCVGDADCSKGDFCNAGICAAKLSDGVQCSTDNSCTSGFCVDGICCSTACTGQCEACDVGGSLGTCTVLTTGSPHMSHAPCAGTGSCQGSCDGSSATACTYPDTTAVCTAASCTDGVESSEATCDGQGTCATPITTSCGDYACETAQCKTACTTTVDCADGSVCATGDCVSPNDGGMAGFGGMGGIDGIGGASNGGTAATGAVPLGGSAGSSIDGDTDLSSGDEGGCGCHLIGHRSNGSPRLWIILAGLFIVISRAARSKRPRPAHDRAN